MHSTAAASASHPRFLQHCCWRSDTHRTQFSPAGTEFARMLGSGISKHGWKDRFLSASAAGQVFNSQRWEKLRLILRMFMLQEMLLKVCPWDTSCLRSTPSFNGTVLGTGYSNEFGKVLEMKAKVLTQYHDSSTWNESQYHETPKKPESRTQSNTGGDRSSSIFSQGQNKSFRTTPWQLRLQQLCSAVPKDECKGFLCGATGMCCSFASL